MRISFINQQSGEHVIILSREDQDFSMSQRSATTEELAHFFKNPNCDGAFTIIPKFQENLKSCIYGKYKLEIAQCFNPNHINDSNKYIRSCVNKFSRIFKKEYKVVGIRRLLSEIFVESIDLVSDEVIMLIFQTMIIRSIIFSEFGFQKREK